MHRTSITLISTLTSTLLKCTLLLYYLNVLFINAYKNLSKKNYIKTM